MEFSVVTSHATEERIERKDTRARFLFPSSIRDGSDYGEREKENE